MPTILVIDDDDLLRDVIAATLTAAGYEVLQAADGRQGRELLAASPADLVLTDLIMPEHEGIETITRLRRIHPQLPIIAMSGGSTNSKLYLDFARVLGARRVLSKPFAPDDLLHLIAEVLAKPPPASRA